MNAAQTRSLYREILRTAQRWPSVKKAKVIAEIRQEFRENRSVSDPEKAKALVSEAHTGLLTLRSQSGLTNKSTDLDFKFGEHG